MKRRLEGESEAACAFEGDGQEAADKALIAAETERLRRFYAALAREMQRHLARGGREFEFWREHGLLDAQLEAGGHAYNYVMGELRPWEKKAA